MKGIFEKQEENSSPGKICTNCSKDKQIAISKQDLLVNFKVLEQRMKAVQCYSKRPCDVQSI